MTIRVKIHADGTATLSGVPYQRLRETLTVAELLCQEHQPDVPKYRYGEDMLAYHRELLKWVRLMRGAMDLGVHNTFPSSSQPLTKEQRFEKVRESERERALMERIMSELRANPKKFVTKVKRRARKEKARDKKQRLRG